MSGEPTNPVEWVEWAKATVPLLAALIVFVGGLLAYGRQRRIDRMETLNTKRREVYASYVLAIQRNISGIRDNDEYQRSLANIYVHGADDVVSAVAAFHKQMADRCGNIDGNSAALAYAKMVSAMRANSFEASKLNADQLKELVPFNYD